MSSSTDRFCPVLLHRWSLRAAAYADPQFEVAMQRPGTRVQRTCSRCLAGSITSELPARLNLAGLRPVQ